MKIIIATGGSGGHLFPALRVAQELKREGHDIVFLGSFNRAKEQIRKSGFAFDDLESKGFIFAFRKEAFSSFVAMIKAVFKALKLLRKFQPDVVLGFGGYGAFPVVLSAVLLRYPALIHEQNVVPGRANAFLAKCVHRVAISFAKSVKYFDPHKTVLTGCPCHVPLKNVNRMEIYEEFHLEHGKKTILVFGGSQGSQHINEVFVETVEVLKEKLDFQVIHVSGRQDYQKIFDRYNHLGIPFALFDFLDRMEKAYHVADLVISRSGAVTVHEIASFQLPAILIPYPYARGHQIENANVLCETNFSRLIEDKDFSVSKLAETILGIFESPVSLRGNAHSVQDICIPDAAQRLARETVRLMQ